MDPLQDAKRLSRDAESELSAAAEDFVSRPRFADTLALAAENIAATTKIAGDAFDLALRNLRVAGRRDLVILANQLGRTEDKLERVLQEIELLRDEVMARSTPEPEKPANSEGSKAGKRRAAPKRKTANSNRLTANE
jgi:hypothetical protein